MYDKAAVYIRCVIGDHPFVDGNKRLAITAGVVFLMRHGYQLTATPKELEDFAVRLFECTNYCRLAEVFVGQEVGLRFDSSPKY